MFFIRLYTVAFYLLLPIIAFRLLWRGFFAPAYWRRWPERLGFFPPLPFSHYVWIHAVSFGEVQAAIPLVKLIKSRFPSEPLLITTMTPTGSQRVKEIFGDSVDHVYLPYDLPDAITRFLDRTSPRLLILIETELWPNLLSACYRRSIPVVLANARLSARSAARYQHVVGLIRPTLTYLSAIATQTQEDADRLTQLGALPQTLSVTGSIKFDIELPSDLIQWRQTLREQWGPHRLVWIAASTHEGEESLLLDCFSKLKQRMSNLLFILVPRHPERFNRVAHQCICHGFETVRRSEGKQCTSTTDIYLGDTMGELLYLYAASDVAFVGGSLVARGGHNPLEPAALGLPIFLGTHVFNFADISRKLLELGAVQQVHDENQLVVSLENCLMNEELRRDMGKKAQLFLQQNQGALQRLMRVLDNYLYNLS